MPPTNPIEDKLQFLSECIDQVEEQIQQRKRHHQEILTELEQKSIDVRNAIYGMDHHDFEDRQKSTLEREIRILERESRQQEIESWRDVESLHKELRKLKKEYRAVRAGARCLEPKN
jgi:hypothetical protein